MKLYYSSASPYVRKVLVMAIETGLDERIERDTRMLTPVNPDVQLNNDNPLGKIPTLMLEDGTTLFDSRVICEYLDTLHLGAPLFPQDTTRWQVLRRQALADGILDAGVITRYETFLRPEELRWGDWIDNQKAKITRALNELETQTKSFQDSLDIGVIAAACALGYLDFRFADLDWRAGRSQLSAWYEEFAQRASMTRTAPQ